MKPVLFIFLYGSNWTGEFSGDMSAQAKSEWFEFAVTESLGYDKLCLDEPSTPPARHIYPSGPKSELNKGNPSQVVTNPCKPNVKQLPKVFGSTQGLPNRTWPPGTFN